jgi:1,4-alpha-glucan branching enzyme
MEAFQTNVSPRVGSITQAPGLAGKLRRRRFIAALLSLVIASPAFAGLDSEPLGAVVEKTPGGRVKGVTFRVWAPNAESVDVIGTFNNWKARRDTMKKENASGVWSLEVRAAKPGDEYLYLINGELERKDPRARQVSICEQRSVVYDPEAFDWGDVESPDSSSAIGEMVMYQMHPGTFHDPDPSDGEPGTLRDAIAKLGHLEEMGVNCVLLMPVNEFNGRHSWGYNPSDQFAVENAYGGPGALKEFVKAAHERGIAVHLDIVHNHYGPENLSLWQFDGYGGGETRAGIYFYEDRERGSTPWGPRPDFGRPEVREFVADQVRMWFDEYRIDGLRWDSTINIRAVSDGAVENPEGGAMLERIASMIRQDYPGKISVAEDSVGDGRFDASWEYDFHGVDRDGVVPQLLRTSDAARRVEEIARRVDSELGFRRVIYTENHDETGRLNGKRRLITEVSEHDPHGLKARRKSALAALLTLTSPGVPLLFMGQELLEPREFHDSNPIEWQRGEDAFRSFLLHRDLVRLRRNLGGVSKALTDVHTRVATVDEERKLLAFRRYLPGESGGDIVVVVNFSGEKLDRVPVKFSRSGTWSVLLNTDDAKYGRDFTGVTTADLRSGSNNEIAVTLAPYSAQIFGLKDPGEAPVDVAELRARWEAMHGGSPTLAAVTIGNPSH